MTRVLAYTALAFVAIAAVAIGVAHADPAPAACDAAYPTLAEALVAPDGIAIYHYDGAPAAKLIAALIKDDSDAGGLAETGTDVVLITDGTNSVFVLFDAGGCFATYDGPMTDLEAVKDLTGAGFKAPFIGGGSGI